MKILLNYDKAEKEYLSSFAYIMRNMGIDAVSTAKNLTISELMSLAKQTECQFVVCCNEQTLRYLVPGDKPTVDMWRGSRLNFEIPCLIINKLAHIHTVPHGSWLLEQDLSKLKYYAHKPVPFRYHKIMDRYAMEAALEEFAAAIFIAYDIETKTYKPIVGEDENAPEQAGETVITCASWTGVFSDGSLKTIVLPLIDYDVYRDWEKRQNLADSKAREKTAKPDGNKVNSPGFHTTAITLWTGWEWIAYQQGLA